ncbi:hypothetical protein BJ508DRAFT_380890 [Ascobolus immersus RN42]|uniref:Uncharacterized protein n=1 Tax=Ascobolus immersus RN42 TaxID=1160509 RepID=A0A3N4HP77_ASCIM|nr:hypothetical protein BJ508DRAFT_380890 [Ascobolus immersus RN42]
MSFQQNMPTGLPHSDYRYTEAQTQERAIQETRERLYIDLGLHNFWSCYYNIMGTFTPLIVPSYGPDAPESPPELSLFFLRPHEVAKPVNIYEIMDAVYCLIATLKDSAALPMACRKIKALVKIENPNERRPEAEEWAKQLEKWLQFISDQLQEIATMLGKPWGYLETGQPDSDIEERRTAAHGLIKRLAGLISARVKDEYLRNDHLIDFPQDIKNEYRGLCDYVLILLSFSLVMLGGSFYGTGLMPSRLPPDDLAVLPIWFISLPCYILYDP